MKDTPKPGNRRPYDAAFRAEALRLAAQSRSTQAESLESRFKTEELERREWTVFADLAGAQASVADCFDYYNHDRLHFSIGYQAPYLTHQQLFKTTTLNCPA